MRSWPGCWLAAGLVVAVASLAACGGPGRAATSSPTVKDRHEAPLERDTTAAPLLAGPPLATGVGGVKGSEADSATGSDEEGASGSSPAGSAAPSGGSVSWAPCGADDLRVAFDVQPPAGSQPADRIRALVVLTDLSGTACAMEGFPVLEEVEGARRTILDARHIDQPGTPADVILEGGMSAFAGLEWTEMAGCPTVSAFWLALPGWGIALPVTMVVPGGTGPPPTVCPDGADLGPVTATSEGTVAFPDALGAGT